MSHQACPKRVLAVTLLLCLAAIQVNSLACVQCTSRRRPECSIEGLVSPTICREISNYCLTLFVLRPDGRDVIRSCSIKKWSGCTTWPVNNINNQVCHVSCATDGCNAPIRPTL